MSGMSGFTSAESPIVSLSEEEIREMLGVDAEYVITCIDGDNVMTSNGYVSIDTASHCQGCHECDPAYN